MRLQCEKKEQGKICKDPECPACLDALIEEELGDIELEIMKRDE